MAFDTITKDPNATLDYGFDWTDWMQTSETISSVTWAIATGITKGSEVTGSYVAKVWLSGGTAGQRYTVACKITTNQSRIDERTMVIVVENR